MIASWPPRKSSSIIEIYTSVTWTIAAAGSAVPVTALAPLSQVGPPIAGDRIFPSVLRLVCRCKRSRLHRRGLGPETVTLKTTLRGMDCWILRRQGVEHAIEKRTNGVIGIEQGHSIYK
jgi:hypothetical protein